jgi:hypothetical protein
MHAPKITMGTAKIILTGSLINSGQLKMLSNCKATITNNEVNNI